MKICFWNGEQICVASEEYDIRLPSAVWLDVPVDYDSSKVYKLEDGVITEVLLSEHNPTRLRVHRILSEDIDPLISDFSILGFRKSSPSYSRGKKLYAKYMCTEKEEIIVDKIFQDIRDEHGTLTGLSVTFNWYAEDNVIRASKTELVKSFNKYEAETEERKRRYRQFDYLKASVKGTPSEPYVAVIINHFSIEINKYQNDGLLDLEQSMLDVINTDLSTLTASEQLNIGTVQQILAAPIERNDGLGYSTVHKFIQYQIGTITLEEL